MKKRLIILIVALAAIFLTVTVIIPAVKYTPKIKANVKKERTERKAYDASKYQPNPYQIP